MARKGPDFATPVRRVLIALLAIVLIALFLFWRIDSPRAERMRTGLIDRVVPSFEWAFAPVTQLSQMVAGFQSYARIYEQNQELRRELQKMQAWKEAAVQLEQENSKLLAQNNVRIDPALTSVTGVVMVDSGSAFRQSVLLNVGAQDGIVDGWATMDGLGLVGRISGVGQRTSRVVLLTDPSSRIPVTIQPSGDRALLNGDNTPLPVLDFVEAPDNVRPGDRVVTSGDGGVFPPGLLVGQVVQASDGRMRLRMAADYGRLEFLRVLRAHPAEAVVDSGAIIRPGDQGLIGPELPTSPVEAARATDPLASVGADD
ncbi:rod shape-determining protein MreC [Paracoccus sp. R12_1]|jgi:rod shape-determining protein MreC|uniref:rod shape-determining protein MreC n=1 Tax=unclassified Paracoccus (in: a-proteobacteria) TaxID=2688777 RepID=UPI000C0B7921|nr:MULTISPECIES: rod shape-determining protein MreC [unclassified Paracoccus (in: a-proteobacteria)]MBO9453632.1 rod shape-determining protein MreC [Paracoccus sp. R12_2]MBO9486944.1 rod shape-determining protein MreC [Paracoccus sp. R12_1]PHQ70011.1 MAG: rod shape-determining protein MreC [Paracoccus sp. (in: a-proteobacteria)]